MSAADDMRRAVSAFRTAWRALVSDGLPSGAIFELLGLWPEAKS